MELLRNPRKSTTCLNRRRQVRPVENTNKTLSSGSTKQRLRVGPTAWKCEPSATATASAPFGDHLDFFIPKAGQITVPISSYKRGPNGEVLAEFEHPITKALCIAGINETTGLLEVRVVSDVVREADPLLRMDDDGGPVYER